MLALARNRWPFAAFSGILLLLTFQMTLAE